MTCLRAQSLITPFIDDKLNIKELEEFIDHINACDVCREELEVYFALLTAMKQLDEDKNLSDNFSRELALKLERLQEKIIHVKYAYYRKISVLIFLITIVSFLFSFGYSNINREKENTVIRSTFRLRQSYRSDRFDYLELQLQEYLSQID
ncbi:MAG: hypothetical protein GX288_07025 [Clostridiales bacterium]|nr:hypothetical protein [Clostridiales bacterium]